MTKLPTITGEELIAALEKAGFSIVRLLVGFYCSGITII
ncbi:MAG: type II toxin-antitoxin system HicA family toxin [Dolichospermum sp.]|jgi:predicted RNA binding protein YcfA (HicA-like mRNA interferase family)